jgi:hypothetical protein
MTDNLDKYITTLRQQIGEHEVKASMAITRMRSDCDRRCDEKWDSMLAVTRDLRLAVAKAIEAKAAAIEVQPIVMVIDVATG